MIIYKFYKNNYAKFAYSQYEVSPQGTKYQI